MSYFSSLLCAAVLLHHVLAQEALQLVLILPLNCSTAMTEGWERGSQLLAAAESAVETINQNTHILQNYTLEMSVVNPVTCPPAQNSGEINILPSLVRSTDQHGLIAAVGVISPGTAKLLTKQTQRHTLKLPLFIGSLYLTPRTQLPSNQFRMLDSALSIAEAVVSFVEYQHWTKIAVITDLENTYYLHVSAAHKETEIQKPNRYLRITLFTGTGVYSAERI